MRFEPDRLPAVDSEGKPVRVIEHGELRIELSLAEQLLAVAAPKPEGPPPSGVVAEDCDLMNGARVLARLRKGHPLSEVLDGDNLRVETSVDGVKLSGDIERNKVTVFPRLEQPEIIPTLEGAIAGKFVSAGMLAQKAKQFDDGLYAAVELAAQDGAGEFRGKKALLRAVIDSVSGQAPTRAAAIVAGAAILGGQRLALPAALHAEALKELEEFRGDPVRSKPLGFYTWSAALSALFRQDRILQTKFERASEIQPLARALAGDAAARVAYERYLDLAARLTNPFVRADLRALFSDAGHDAAGGGYAVLPPSVSHENSLLERLFGNDPVPEGFDLMQALIERVRAGEIDLIPTGRSGWYDYQAYALETLISPDRGDEASRLQLDEGYRNLLADLFKGALALARETHAKQLYFSEMIGAREHEPREQIQLAPDLSAEPLVTHYRRRADGYRFVRAVLENAFGARALAALHRQTAQGPVSENLGAELDWMIDLFDGAATVTARQLGMTTTGATAVAAAGRFLHWAAQLADDPDLSRDQRMMVPVWREQDGRIKAWAFLGWTRRDVTFSYVAQPFTAGVYNRSGRRVFDGPDIVWNARAESLLYPVMAEVYVRRLLDRDAFRRHCDTYRTRAAILAGLL